MATTTTTEISTKHGSEQSFRYIVELPQYYGAQNNSYHRISVRILRSCGSPPGRVYYSDVPPHIRALDRCEIIIEHFSENLDRELLVQDIIELGYGQKSMCEIVVPVRLRHGGTFLEAGPRCCWRASDDSPEVKSTTQDPSPVARENANDSLPGFASVHRLSRLPRPNLTSTANHWPSNSSTSYTNATSYYTSPAHSSSYGISPASFRPSRSSRASPAYSFPYGHSPASFMTARSSRASPAYSFPYGRSPASFVTARSSHASPAYSFTYGRSPASFVSARYSQASPASVSAHGSSPADGIDEARGGEMREPEMPPPLKKLRDEYHTHLNQQNIVQPFEKELNWSGKGQHVSFLPLDPVPLQVISFLGASMTAKVDKVLCRRIALARKTMRCSRQLTISEALVEVYHLQNLRHHHILQLVGTYLQGRDFSILLYPVADCHLGAFLEDTADIRLNGEKHPRYSTLAKRYKFLATCFACLTSALSFVHDHTTKHMDIKPQNILVRKTGAGTYRTYLADFGLSRSFASQGHSQTDGPTSRTVRYCAPEVFHYESRGRAADIFSLGCVFTEIITVLWGRHPYDFVDYRTRENTDESFHATLGRVHLWLANSISIGSWGKSNDTHVRSVLRSMLKKDPEARPTARAIQTDVELGQDENIFSPRACCGMAPEQYLAYEEGNEENKEAPDTNHIWKVHVDWGH